MAAAKGHTRLTEVYRWFQFGLAGADDSDFEPRLHFPLHLSQGAKGHEVDARAVNAMLAYADLGASAVKATKIDEDEASEFTRMRKAIREAVGDKVVLSTPAFKDVRVVHHVGDRVFELPLQDESSGTQTWIGLAGLVVTALGHGAVLCIDELDARLHPQLVDTFVGMFMSPTLNHRGAQLICSTHDVSLIGRHAKTEISRDQIWLTEKDAATLATAATVSHTRRSATPNYRARYPAARRHATTLCLPDVDGIATNPWTNIHELVDRVRTNYSDL
ncbi:ATP-binding protein [Nocardia cyriacigeorgica]|uniref:ATP-binding protein n=1 Tax=Nocardia cyriacigeorgica TaxID=135487 RepID=A0A6P1CN63_9NOCA|nr:ATP-binding protein [Nocardia cyriacigeorgica]MBF6082790.1 ATP-binding protein [Nocardia cyriacigeorgica]MBF6427178.1 ATP-binding protein [Nocardia cyriacigeorgica]NEW33362.1 ATP-binding protein [Nocardia cyriacigeorgica]